MTVLYFPQSRFSYTVDKEASGLQAGCVCFSITEKSDQISRAEIFKVIQRPGVRVR